MHSEAANLHQDQPTLQSRRYRLMHMTKQPASKHKQLLAMEILLQDQSQVWQTGTRMQDHVIHAP